MPAVGGRGVGRKAERGGGLTHADAVGAPVKGWAAQRCLSGGPPQAFWNLQDVASDARGRQPGGSCEETLTPHDLSSSSARHTSSVPMAAGE